MLNNMIDGNLNRGIIVIVLLKIALPDSSTVGTDSEQPDRWKFEPWDNSDRASQDESFLRLIAPYINRTNYPPFLGLRGSLLLTLLDKIQPAHFMNKTGRLIIILRLRLIRVMLLHLINAEGWETTARELVDYHITSAFNSCYVVTFNKCRRMGDYG